MFTGCQSFGLENESWLEDRIVYVPNSVTLLFVKICVLICVNLWKNGTLEPGTWNLEPGTWNLEPGTWNPGTLEPLFSTNVHKLSTN